jgi:hypothetical protein
MVGRIAPWCVADQNPGGWADPLGSFRLIGLLRSPARVFSRCKIPTIETNADSDSIGRQRRKRRVPLPAESEALRTGFRRKPDSVPMIADSR